MTTEIKATDRQRLKSWFELRLSKPAADLTPEERTQLRGIFVQQAEAAQKTLASRISERPSYATRATVSEQSAAADLRGYEGLLAAYDEWMETMGQAAEPR